MKLAAALLALAACATTRTAGGDASPGPRVPDAPVDLAGAGDRAAARADYEALPPGPERVAARRLLLAHDGRSLTAALADDRRAEAVAALHDLAELYAPDDLADAAAVAAELAPYRDAVARVRTDLTAHGGEVDYALALAVEAAAAPADAAAAAARLDEELAFSDELAVAERGEGAERSRSIAALEAAVELFPTPFLVDRLHALLVARQAAVEALSRKGPTDVALLRAHRSVLRTTWSLVRLHALAGHVGDAAPALASLHGLGDDREIKEEVAAVVAPNAPGADWIRLAWAFVGDGSRPGDLLAAQRILDEGLAHGGDAGLHTAAGEVARRRDQVPLAIHHLEAAFAAEPRRDVAEALAALYEARLATLVDGERPAAARARMAELERFHADAGGRFGRLDPDVADAWAIMARGLLGLGEIGEAERYLARSLARRQTVDALELSAVIALEGDRAGEAVKGFSRAHDLASEQPARLRLLRQLGEARAEANDTKGAAADWQRALVGWHGLLLDENLPSLGRAAGELEVGRLSWALGDRDEALAAFARAVDAAGEDGSLYAQVVAFLAVRGEYAAAADACHGALGLTGVADDTKVYMSLWLLAEGRRSGRPDDPVAAEFLAGRRGGRWPDALARWAVGRGDERALAALADRRSRRAELLYYRAVLAVARRDPAAARRMLREVVGAGMLLFVEHDMARQLLAPAARLR